MNKEQKARINELEKRINANARTPFSSSRDMRDFFRGRKPKPSKFPKHWPFMDHVTIFTQNGRGRALLSEPYARSEEIEMEIRTLCECFQLEFEINPSLSCWVPGGTNAILYWHKGEPHPFAPKPTKFRPSVTKHFAAPRNLGAMWFASGNQSIGDVWVLRTKDGFFVEVEKAIRYARGARKHWCEEKPPVPWRWVPLEEFAQVLESEIGGKLQKKHLEAAQHVMSLVPAFFEVAPPHHQLDTRGVHSWNSVEYYRRELARVT